MDAEQTKSEIVAAIEKGLKKYAECISAKFNADIPIPEILHSEIVCDIIGRVVVVPIIDNGKIDDLGLLHQELWKALNYSGFQKIVLTLDGKSTTKINAYVSLKDIIPSDASQPFVSQEMSHQKVSNSSICCYTIGIIVRIVVVICFTSVIVSLFYTPPQPS